MRGISILLALIIGTFSHTGYFNRVADTAERSIRKISGAVLIGKIILQNMERLGSSVRAEDGMPEGLEGDDEGDLVSDRYEEEAGEVAADETVENPVSSETEELTSSDREASETAWNMLSPKKARPRATP